MLPQRHLAAAGGVEPVVGDGPFQELRAGQAAHGGRLVDGRAHRVQQRGVPGPLVQDGEHGQRRRPGAPGERGDGRPGQRHRPRDRGQRDPAQQGLDPPLGHARRGPQHAAQQHLGVGVQPGPGLVGPLGQLDEAAQQRPPQRDGAGGGREPGGGVGPAVRRSRDVGGPAVREQRRRRGVVGGGGQLVARGDDEPVDRRAGAAHQGADAVAEAARGLRPVQQPAQVVLQRAAVGQGHLLGGGEQHRVLPGRGRAGPEDREGPAQLGRGPREPPAHEDPPQLRGRVAPAPARLPVAPQHGGPAGGVPGGEQRPAPPVLPQPARWAAQRFRGERPGQRRSRRADALGDAGVGRRRALDARRARHPRPPLPWPAGASARRVVIGN